MLLFLVRREDLSSCFSYEEGLSQGIAVCVLLERIFYLEAGLFTALVSVPYSHDQII